MSSGAPTLADANSHEDEAGEDRPAAMARTALAVVIFAIGMGYVEAAVVVDLREALGLSAVPSFPVQETALAQRLALIEVGREFAAVVMLVGVGVAAGRHGWEWLAWTAVAFGVWDITYYGWLWVFLGWPASLFDWDLLFLIPVPWVGPVWAPVAVSLALVWVGLVVARRYRAGWNLRLRIRDLAAGVGGGLLVVLSFTSDGPRLANGGLPGWFPWPLFGAGVLLAVGGAIDVLSRSQGRRRDLVNARR